MGAFTPGPAPFIVPILVADPVDLASFTFDLAHDPAQYAIATGCDRSGADPSCDAIDGPVTLGTFYAGFALFSPLFVPGFVFTDLVRQPDRDAERRRRRLAGHHASAVG